MPFPSWHDRGRSRRQPWVLAGDEHVAEYRPPANVETVTSGDDAETTPLTVLASNPGLAVELFAAFAIAKRAYLIALWSGTVVDPTPADTMYRTVFEITGEDPLPYGIEPNRGMLDEFLRHALDQHLIDAALPVEPLFSKDAVELVG